MVGFFLTNIIRKFKSSEIFELSLHQLIRLDVFYKVA